MKPNRVVTWPGLVTCLVAPWITLAAQPEGKIVERDDICSGKLEKRDLIKAAPSRLFVSDEKEFEKIWRAWRGEEKLPKIDFTKSIVVVGALEGPKEVSFRLRLDEKGDLTIGVGSLPVEDDGRTFGYSMVAIKREGIKTINGKSIK